jgi:DNA-nicking Smr family endonuclease
MARHLAPDEKALWGKVMATVKPLHPVHVNPPPTSQSEAKSAAAATRLHRAQSDKPTLPRVIRVASLRAMEDKNTLDASWDRRIKKGVIIPDISIDLHGQGLSSAHSRLDHALDQSIQQRLRIILLVTGKLRAHDRASGAGRGAIAAVVRDWLAASRFASHISAVRQAHPRHGGDGALYIILKR